jgi:hypothetical protein
MHMPKFMSDGQSLISMLVMQAHVKKKLSNKLHEL